MFLVGQLGIANREERIQAFESRARIADVDGQHVRVPKHEVIAAGSAGARRGSTRCCFTLGLATRKNSAAPLPRMNRPPDRATATSSASGFGFSRWPISSSCCSTTSIPACPRCRSSRCWAAGEVLTFEGNFNKYVTSNGLQKQEGVIFRHLLRLILLLGEFRELVPLDCDPFAWQDELDDIAARLTETCRRIDPSSTEKTLEEVRTEPTL